MKEENYLEGIYGCLERIEKKVETLPVEGTSPAVGNRTSSPEGIAELKIRLERLQSAVEKNGLEIAAVRNHTVRLSEGWPLSAETFAGEMEKIRYCLSQDCQAVKETVRRLDERMVLLKKEPERRLVTYRLESASKAVVTTASALFLALIVSVWTNCNQYRTNRLLKDADLKYRAIRICLPGDDPDIAFLEKHFTIKRDEEKIRRVERLVTAFEDSVRNRIRNHEMAAYKDSLAHRLFREAQKIRKQLDNPKFKMTVQWQQSEPNSDPLPWKAGKGHFISRLFMEGWHVRSTQAIEFSLLNGTKACQKSS